VRTIVAIATGVVLSFGGVAGAQPGGAAAPRGGVSHADEKEPGTPASGTEESGTEDRSSPPGPNPSSFTPTGAFPQPASNSLAPTTARASATTPWLSRVGMAALIGGGFEAFTADSLQGMTGTGATWAARAVAGTRQLVGVEAAYIGAARSLDGSGLGNASLMSNGVEAAARFNVPVPLGRSLLEPFAFVGLGWQHYSVRGAGSASLNSSDDVLTLPYGAGLEFAYGMLIADARFTYRQTYLNDLVRVGDGRLSNWGASLQLGVEF
jgi:hypothetical protein